MSGASFAHHQIGMNLATEVHGQRKGKTCTVVGRGPRVQVRNEAAFGCPDLTAVCGVPPFQDQSKPDTLLNPALLGEVLAPATKSNDRGDKHFFYRQIPRLRHYLLLDSQTIHAGLHTRDEQGRWVLTETSDRRAALELEGLGCRVALADA